MRNVRTPLLITLTPQEVQLGMRDFHRELVSDKAEVNVVKLGMRETAPFEITGIITEVTQDTFTIESYGEVYTRNVSDILHYRLA
jgi:hypothetical protein